MSRRPLAPDLWEQALINGRRIHPEDDGAALGWATGWYEVQGGRFEGEQPPAPAPEPLEPQAEAAAAAAELEPADEAEEAASEQPEAAPEPARPGKQRRRARQDAGHFRGDNPATPGVNEAWEGGDAA